MHKILVFSSLLAFAGGSYAAEQGQQAAAGDQSATTTQSPAGQGATSPSGSGQDQSASASSGTQAGSSQETAEQKQSIPYNFAAGKLMGQQVTNSQGEQIGSVEDVIVDDQGKVSHAVLGVGGFLGVGQRQVAVPFAELQVQGDSVVYASGDKQQLSEMPQFQYKEEQQQASGQQEQQTAEAPSLPGQGQPSQ